MQDNAHVFKALFADVPGMFIGITSFRGDKPVTCFFRSEKVQDAYQHALQCNANKENAYFSVKAYADVPEKGRGVAADPGAFSFAWLDLDYGVEGHKSDKNPPTREAALGLINQFSHAPSLIVFTGHGLQAFWCFDKPVDATDESGRSTVSRLVDAIQSTIAQYAAVKGWQVDNTADLARIMRVPGTVNYKDPANPVQGSILEFQPDRQYSVEELLAACLPATKNAKQFGPKSNRMVVEAGTIPESRRNQTLTSLAGSMRQRGMTQGAIALALQAENEERCEVPLPEEEVATIARSVCRYEPGHTQADDVLHAEASLAEIMPQIALNPAQAFQAATIEALAILSMYDQLAYTRAKVQIKNLCKSRVAPKDLAEAVQKAVSKLRAERQATETEPSPQQRMFPDLGYPLTVPNGFRITAEGIIKKGKEFDELVFPTAVTISRRFRNPRSGLEMVEIIFNRGNQVFKVAAERSVVFSRHKLMEMADNGLPVTSENAKDLVVFLSEVERANDIPVVPCTASLGWVDETSILPWDADAGYLDKRGFEELAASIGEKGVLEEWIKLTGPARRSVFGRLMLAAAYASPLVSIVGTRTAGVMLWGGSQAGKTAVLKAATSIFGHPEKLMLNMFATKVSLEQSAGFLRHLPLFIDERQLAGNDQALEQLIYMLSGGAGKGRGTKNGGVRARGEWENMALMTGEFPLSNESSAAGVRGRLLEVNVKQVVSAEDGKQLHRELPKHYGTAGAAYIAHVKAMRDSIRERFEGWDKKVSGAFPDISGSHAGMLAVIGLADELASVGVHKESEEEAAKSAWAFIQELSRFVITKADQDDAERAKNWVIAKFQENHKLFTHDEHHRYGMLDNDLLKINPAILNKFLMEGGFNPVRSKQDFMDRGWMKKFKDKDGKDTDRWYDHMKGYVKGYYHYLLFPEWALTPKQRDKFGWQPDQPMVKT